MTKIIYFEYCALVIEALILVSIYQRNMMRGRVNRWYVAVVSAIMASTIFDIVGMLLEMNGPGNVLLKYIANLLCLWCTQVGSVVLCGYLFAQTGLWYKLKGDKITGTAFYLPLIINTVLLVAVNPFTRIIFYIDEEGMYARGDGIILLYLLSLVYVYFGSCTVIKYRKIYTIRKIFSIFLLLGAAIIATVIQLIFPNVIIQMFCTACAALILLLDVQAPEERIHPGTGYYSMNAYVQDVRNSYYLGSHFEDILVVITNYTVLVEMLGYFKVSDLIRELADEFVKYARSLSIDANYYYLGDGRFSIILDDRYIGRQFELAQGINMIMNIDRKVGENRVKIMGNVCAILCPEDIDDPDFLIAFDERLAKEAYSGELRYAESLFDKKMFEFNRDFTQIADSAFSNGYFSLQYQPVFNGKENRYTSAEAFLRFNDPVYGYVPPNVIIAEAEKSHIIHAITTFVVEEVCKFISQPEFLFLGLDYVEINLSPIQCSWSDLMAVVTSTIRSYNVQPKYICFNITDIEDYRMFNLMKDNLEALVEYGFRLIMDDFGDGIFEIERIATMPLCGVKLDRSFVKNGLERENLSVLRGTIRMINDMGIDALAVGVENEETKAQLQELGCMVMQGYYYCKPMDKNELIRFLLLD